MKNITLKDLAHVLEISISTVSKALNDNPEISFERRAQVKQLANSLNYHPNKIAQSLKTRRTYTIGVVIPNLTENFFAILFEEIEKKAVKNGYRIIPCISNDSLRKECKALENLINGGVDGILISLGSETQNQQYYNHLSKLKHLEIPLVMFDRTSEHICCDKVIIDDEKSGYKATKHLLLNGCKKVMFLSEISNTNVSCLRYEGYKNAINEDAGTATMLRIRNYEAFDKQLLTFMENNKVDGIVAAGGRTAIHAMNTLQVNGYRIPQDVSIIGFTNGDLSKHSYPSLTTIDQHAGLIGKTSVKLLMERMEKLYIGKPICETIDSTLIYRASTRNMQKNHSQNVYA